LEALGELDELNSLIGVVKNYVKEHKKKLQEV
jgi:cob(I)alamin adenosyltransferase